MANRNFGRFRVSDSRDHEYKIRRLASKRRSRTWKLGPQLDQGDTPQCVGYATLGFFQASPIRQTPMSAEGIYRFAQHEDEWSGNNYEGTSVRGAMKAMAYCGLIGEYQWAFDIEAVINHVLEVGPMIVGTNWYSKMASVDDDGFVTVGGRLEGGHAYLINAANVSRESFGFRNSWGRDYGIDGGGKISFKHFERLLAEDGECCTATEVRANG